MNPTPLAFLHAGQPTTTSLVVAEKFGKRHKDVLRAIRNLECSEEFRERNFALTIRAVPGPKGAVRHEDMYLITRDGFAFLAFGFTGREAARWKEAFLAAFNRLADAFQDPLTGPLARRLVELGRRLSAMDPYRAHMTLGGLEIVGKALGICEDLGNGAPPPSQPRLVRHRRRRA